METAILACKAVGSSEEKVIRGVVVVVVAILKNPFVALRQTGFFIGWLKKLAETCERAIAVFGIVFLI